MQPMISATLGLAGAAGAFAPWFWEIVEADIWRPRRFMAVWGVHLGGYIGCAVGGVGVLVWMLLWRSRHRQPADLGNL